MRNRLFLVTGLSCPDAKCETIRSPTLVSKSESRSFPFTSVCFGNGSFCHSWFGHIEGRKKNLVFHWRLFWRIHSLGKQPWGFSFVYSRSFSLCHRSRRNLVKNTHSQGYNGKRWLTIHSPVIPIYLSRSDAFITSHRIFIRRKNAAAIFFGTCQPHSLSSFPIDDDGIKMAQGHFPHIYLHHRIRYANYRYAGVRLRE